MKNREVELARASLEEKAEQLSLISKYKSEFLANMSHELRTPLNSLLILAKLLADNKDANLSEKQVEYAKTIYASGGDLLTLINEILDLSKVEAGKMQIEPRDIALTDLRDYFERTFRPVAEQKGLRFEVEIAAGIPTSIRTDPQLPWLPRRVKRRIDDFETVMRSRWPTVQDMRLPGWGRVLLQSLSSWRYALGVYGYPIELEWTQKMIKLRQPRYESL